MKNGFQIRHALPLVLVALVITGEIVGWGAIYTELKGWQAGIAALIGFGGLIAAALYHAGENRKRDDRLHATQAQLLAATLHAELAAIGEFTATAADGIGPVAGRMEEASARNPALGEEEFEASPWPVYPTAVYDAAARDIGMLGFELGAKVVRTYTMVKYLRDRRDQTLPTKLRLFADEAREVGEMLKSLASAIDDVLADLSAFDPDADDI